MAEREGVLTVGETMALVDPDDGAIAPGLRLTLRIAGAESNFAIALSASLLIRARYLSRMSCARRSLWPVIETISGSVQPASANIVTVVPRMSWK